MNLQARVSVFRSRKSRQRNRATRADLATTFMGERLRQYNERLSVRRAKRGH